jgi:hypothetical protein
VCPNAMEGGKIPVQKLHIHIIPDSLDKTRNPSNNILLNRKWTSLFLGDVIPQCYWQIS